MTYFHKFHILRKKLMYKQPIRIEHIFVNRNFVKSRSKVSCMLEASVCSSTFLVESSKSYVHDILSQIPYFKSLLKKHNE